MCALTAAAGGHCGWGRYQAAAAIPTTNDGGRGSLLHVIYDGFVCAGPVLFDIYDGFRCAGPALINIYDGFGCRNQFLRGVDEALTRPRLEGQFDQRVTRFHQRADRR